MEYLSLREVILHIVLLDCLDSDLFTSQFMNTQRDFSEGTFSNQFYKFVEIQRRRRQLIVFLNVLFDIFD